MTKINTLDSSVRGERIIRQLPEYAKVGLAFAISGNLPKFLFMVLVEKCHVELHTESIWMEPAETVNKFE